MKRTIRLSENNLHRIIKESVKRILKEYEEEPRWKSDEDIHKEYEDFQINEFRIEPTHFRYSDEYGWDVGFEIEFPNVEHDENHDFFKWENVIVYDEIGEKMGFDNWYPQDISEQLKSMIRSEIQKHKSEMEALKERERKEKEARRQERERIMAKYRERTGRDFNLD